MLGSTLVGRGKIEFDAAHGTITSVLLRTDWIGPGVSSTAIVRGASAVAAGTLRVTRLADADLSRGGLRFPDGDSGSAEGDRLPITGREGSDTRIGDAGADRFVSNVAPGPSDVDPIGDFSTGDDRIIFNAANGNPFDDPDGLGGVALVGVARLDAGLALGRGDFAVGREGGGPFLGGLAAAPAGAG